MDTKRRPIAIGPIEPAGMAARMGIPAISSGGHDPMPIHAYRDTIDEHPPWIVPGIIFTGGVTLLSAAPKVGKSTFTMNMVRKMEEPGSEFLGQIILLGGPVLLITEEGGVSVGYKTEGVKWMFVYDRKMAAGETFSETLSKAAKWVKAQENNNCLVIIDTFAAWAGVEDENSATAVTGKMQEVIGLAQINQCAVLLIHHMRKSGGANGEGIRGSGAMYASVDHSLEMTRINDDPTDTRRRIDITSRIGRPGRWHLDYDTEAQEYFHDDDPPPDTKADKADGRVSLLPVHGKEKGLTNKEVGLLWKMGTKGAEDALERYYAEGKVILEQETTGNKTKQWWRAEE